MRMGVPLQTGTRRRSVSSVPFEVTNQRDVGQVFCADQLIDDGSIPLLSSLNRSLSSPGGQTVELQREEAPNDTRI